MRGELKKLALENRRLDAEDVAIVGKVIKHDEIVRIVYLQRCHIDPQGVCDVAEALKSNQIVRILRLDDNLIGNEGAKAFISALAHNCCVIWISVFDSSTDAELEASIKYLTGTRNKILIPAAVRRVSLLLVGIRRSLPLSGAEMFLMMPKEIVKMSRRDQIWIQTISHSQQTGESDN